MKVLEKGQIRAYGQWRAAEEPGRKTGEGCGKASGSREYGGLRMCVNHKWVSSFVGDRTFFKCKECGETFWIKTKEKACPKWNAIEEGALQE